MAWLLSLTIQSSSLYVRNGNKLIFNLINFNFNFPGFKVSITESTCVKEYSARAKVNV